MKRGRKGEREGEEEAVREIKSEEERNKRE